MAANLGAANPPLSGLTASKGGVSKAIDEMESMRQEMQKLKAEKMELELAREKAESERDEANKRNQELFQTIETINATVEQTNKTVAEQDKSHSEAIIAARVAIAEGTENLEKLLVENCSLKAQIKQEADRSHFSSPHLKTSKAGTGSSYGLSNPSHGQPQTPSSPAVAAVSLGSSSNTAAVTKSSIDLDANNVQHKTENETKVSVDESDAQSTYLHERLHGLLHELLETSNPGIDSSNQHLVQGEALDFDDGKHADNDRLIASPTVKHDHKSGIQPSLIEKKIRDLLKQKNILEMINSKINALYNSLNCGNVPETPLKDMNEDFQRKIEAISSEVSSLLEKKKKYDSTIKGLTDQIARHDALTAEAKHNLENEKHNIEKLLRKQQREFEKKNLIDVEKKKGELDSLKTHEEQCRQEMLGLESQLAQRKTEMEKLNKTLSSLRDTDAINRELMKEKLDLQSNLKRARLDIDRFKKEAEDALLDRDRYKKNIAQTKTAAADVKFALEKALKELEFANHNLQRDIKKTGAELQENVDRVARAKIEIRRLRGTLGKLLQDNLMKAEEAVERENQLLKFLNAGDQVHHKSNPPLLYAASMSFAAGEKAARVIQGFGSKATIGAATCKK